MRVTKQQKHLYNCWDGTHKDSHTNISYMYSSFEEAANEALNYFKGQSSSCRILGWIPPYIMVTKDGTQEFKIFKTETVTTIEVVEVF